MMRNIFYTAILVLIFLSLKNKEIFSQTTGPESGTLLIIGGNANDSIFIPMFKELAGGKNAEIVIVPTALDDEGLSKDPEFKELISRFEKYHFKKISVLHPRKPEKAKSPDFVAPLHTASGV